MIKYLIPRFITFFWLYDSERGWFRFFVSERQASSRSLFWMALVQLTKGSRPDAI